MGAAASISAATASSLEDEDDATLDPALRLRKAKLRFLASAGVDEPASFISREMLERDIAEWIAAPSPESRAALASRAGASSDALGARPVRVERIAAATLAERDEKGNPTACNTSNHWETSLGQSLSLDDYNAELALTAMEAWLRPLAHLCSHRGEGVHALRVTVAQLKADDPERVAREVEAACMPPDARAPEHGWFVRTSDCSPKDAPAHGGPGPHHFVLYALKACLWGSARCQTAISNRRVNALLRRKHAILTGKLPRGTQLEADDAEAATVFLLPFDPAMATRRELRVFVCEGRVTAISQYDWFDTATVFSAMSDAELARVARAVEAFYVEKLNPAWSAVGGTASIIMDVEYLAETDEVQLIELNSFGAEFASGSALFHWMRDRDIVYRSPASSSEPQPICIRVLE